jgi:hypothetical protein
LLDNEVRQDLSTAPVAGLMMGILLLIGVFFFFLMGGKDLVKTAGSAGPVVLFTGLGGLGLIAAGTAAIHLAHKDRTTTPVGTVLSGLAIGVGSVLLFLFFLCLTILSTCKCSPK